MTEVPGGGAGPDPYAIRTRADLAAALDGLKRRSALSYRALEKATAAAPGSSYKLPFTTIRDYVRGRSVPTPDRLDHIVWACGVTDEPTRKAWTEALHRVSDAAPAVPRWTPGPNPYRGLEPFRTEDADHFHGRERLVDALLGRLTPLAGTGGVLLVLGSSGSGKTSLLQAGLVPAVRAGLLPGPVDRRVAVLTPGDGAALQAVAAAHGEPAPPLLVVDRMEEVLAAEHHDAVLDALEAARAGGALLVLGLRADRYPQALAQPRLAVLLDGPQLAVGPMSDGELRRAVLAPAEAAGGSVQDGLVDVVLAELRPDPAIAGPNAVGVLPLLSHTLARTWDRSPDGALTVAGYRAGGGVPGALAGTAEQVWDGLDPEGRRLARGILLRLVRVGADGGADRRRRATRAELASAGDDPAVQDVLDRLVRGRVLHALQGSVEITHEALLHAWPRMAGWLREDRAGHVVRCRLTDAVREWERSGRDDGALLYGAPLAEAREWASGTTVEAWPAEAAFVAASLRREEADRSRSRRRDRILLATGALAGLLLGAAVGTSRTGRRRPAGATYAPPC